MTSPIQLCNTLTGAREPLRTERTDHVTMCVCGPTVFDHAHVGNARPAAVFVVLARTEAVVSEREQARRVHDFARAGALRRELAEAGILVQDTPQGSTWTLTENALA